MAQLSFKQSFIYLPSLQPAYDMAARCEKTDGFSQKIYWHALRERTNDNNALDFLCFIDDNLVGMLNVLFFAESVELTPLVDPAYRGQGIGKKLIIITLAKLQNYVVSNYSFICNVKAEQQIAKCKAKGGVYDHEEIEMFAPTKLMVASDKPLVLERAQLSDVAILAKIHEESFEKPSAAQMELRFSVTLKEPHRKAYLAKTPEGQVVGKLHVREDHHRIYLHDVGISPEFRRQGYGKALMINWLKEFANNYTLPIAVEVLGDNIAALDLYKKCGFHTINVYQFYKFPFNQV
jgi:ribosomal protein S18 acetylase RimI-like enzyme